MISYAVLVIAVAAIGGVVLANSVLRGKLAPWGLSLVHAALGAIGLLLIAFPVIRGVAPAGATTALVVLAIAALGGFFLAGLHLKDKIAPKGVVAIHAAAAAGGLVLLVLSLLGATG